MNATALSPRASATVAALLACASTAALDAANDNAGVAWTARDAAPYVDDDRVLVHVRLRNARAVAEQVGAALATSPPGATAGIWYGGAWIVNVADAPRAAVVFRSAAARSPANRRYTLVLRELLRAAGLDVWQR